MTPIGMLFQMAVPHISPFVVVLDRYIGMEEDDKTDLKKKKNKEIKFQLVFNKRNVFQQQFLSIQVITVE